jgi:hypothetical protein
LEIDATRPRTSIPQPGHRGTAPPEEVRTALRHEGIEVKLATWYPPPDF